MSDCCKRIHRLLKAFDMFPATQYLRYRGEPEYETATGGCTSLLIIGIFVGLFASMGLQTLRKQIISSSVSVSYELDPSPLKSYTRPDSAFMFAFNVLGLDLNHPNVTYFDLTLIQAFYAPNFTPINSTVVPLEPCTPDRFSMLEDHEKQAADFRVQTWKCPPADFEFSAGGKLNSEYFSLFTLRVSKCDPNVTSNCIADADLAALQYTLGEFRIATPLITTIINPDDQVYHSLFVDERNAYSFTTSFGFRAKVYLEESQVDTDVSLMPYTEVVSQKFKTISEYFQTMEMSTARGMYVEINFQKSSFKKTYTRSFNKIDNYFSYVGGIIGTILGFIFIMHAYSERAYGVSMASQLYLDDDGRPISSGGFNFFTMVSVFMLKALRVMGCSEPNWKRTEFYSYCIDEIDQQLDVALLMKKLKFCERALSLLFSEHQLEAMYVQEKETLNQAGILRKKYQIEQKLKKCQESSELTLQTKGESHAQLAQSGCGHPQVIDFDGRSVNEASSQAVGEELSAVSVSSASQSFKQKIKTNLIKVVGQAEAGNVVSEHLANRINSQLFPQLYPGSGSSWNLRVRKHKPRNKRSHKKQTQQKVIHLSEEMERHNTGQVLNMVNNELVYQEPE